MDVGATYEFLNSKDATNEFLNSKDATSYSSNINCIVFLYITVLSQVISSMIC